MIIQQSTICNTPDKCSLKTHIPRVCRSGFIAVMYTLLIGIFLITCGCASISKIKNDPVKRLPTDKQRYSFTNHIKNNGLGDILFILAFSGGGTRASALSYGVLEELKDTWYEVDGERFRLLDEVDRINGVSGGSFTAAYYGLYGDVTFAEFKHDFLYKDIEGQLESAFFNVFNILGRIFSDVSRTEDAIRIYDRNVFRKKTFADLQMSGGPFILINATDLNSHNQFVFTQDYFDLFCSDLSQFRISRAVAASSGVPVLFDPILIQRHPDCTFTKPDWLLKAEKQAETQQDYRLQEVLDAYDFYLDPDTPPYATLVDGGVTDNLGIRAILSNVMLHGKTENVEKTLEKAGPVKHVVILVVNASTTALTNIGKSRKTPSFADVLTAVTDIQLHRYNLESNSLVKDELAAWAESVSKPGKVIKPYFIELSIDDTDDQELLLFFNKIPTSFALEKEQVDKVIKMARQLLRKDPDYLKLIKNLNGQLPEI